LLTSLVEHGKVKTTPKRAKILKAQADSFFAKLITLSNRYENPKDGEREADRLIKSIIYGDHGKKVKHTRLPKFKKDGKTTNFVSDYKLGFRKGDGVEQILIKIN